MTDDQVFFQMLTGIVVISALLCSITAYASWNLGVEAGRIEVASGKVTCDLIEQEDKTTEWECKEND